MSDKNEFDTEPEAALKECLPDLDPGQGHVVAAKLVETIGGCLETIESSNDEIDNANKLARIRNTLSSMVYSHSLSPMHVLDMILKVQKRETLQMLLHFLPSLMENQQIDSATEPIVSVLIDTWHRAPTARLPILLCLSLLPLTGEARKASFQQAFQSLPLVDESDWPVLIRISLRTVSEKGEAMMLWSTVRAHCKDIKITKHFMLAVQFIFEGFRQDQKRALLITSFLHCLKESEDAPTHLDVFVLLGLSNEYEDPIDKILDSWLIRQCFPFSLCETLLQQICSSNRIVLQLSLYQRILNGLLRLAIFLLLTPARLIDCDMQPVVKLVLEMVNVFDHEHQESLLSSLVHLSEEADGMAVENMERTKRPSESLSSFRSVNNVLKRVSQQSPHLLVPFKEAFMRRLSCDSSEASKIAFTFSVEDICSILVAISEATQSGYQELIDLLQRLLFLSTGGYCLSSDDSTQVVRGLVLARTMVSSSAASDSEIGQIKEWVHKIMLPSTRRTIAPEVGRASLLFLQALANRDASSSTAKSHFDQFRMVLANTGLIQKLSKYKGSYNLTRTILAYQDVPPELASYTPEHEEERVSPHDIIFCVDFFLCRTNVTDPTRWESTCLWVFELVDTYLTLARGNGKKDWTAEGWLQASIEFSKMPFPSVSSAVDAALEDAHDYSLYSHVQQIGNAHDEGKLTQDFVQSLCQYEIALLVGIALSLAVLKNASEHFTSTSVLEQSPSRQRLLLYQMLKLYHLKSKSSKVSKLLQVLKISSKRKRQEVEKSFKLNRRRKDSSVNENEVQSIVHVDSVKLSSTVERAAWEIEKIHELLFSGSYLPSKILWLVLQEYYADNSFLKILKHKIVARDHFRPFDLMMVTFQCTFLEELALAPKSLSLSSSHEGKAIVFGLIQSMKAVVDYYIQFRHRNLDDTIDSQVNDVTIQLARAYCKLVSTVLTDFEHLHEPLPEQQDDARSEFMVACNSREKVEGKTSTAMLLFELISSQLKNIEDIGIAHFQLDILACLATQPDIKSLDKVIEMSWSSLHAIFPGSIEFVSQDWERNLSRVVQRKQDTRPPDVGIPLNSIIEALASSSRAISVQDFAPHCLAVIRHLALISHTADRFLQYSNHIVKLVEETESLAASLHSAIRGDKVGIDGKPRTSRAVLAPSLPFLNSATLPDFFQNLLSMIALIMGCMEPALTVICSNNEGPYQHLKFALVVFRRLMSIFRNHFAIFPTRSTRAVSSISRDFMEIMILQLGRCVDWRNEQPIVAVAQRTRAIDVGSLAYLDELIQLYMSPVIGDVSRLCDFFVERNDGPYFPFKRTNLRASVERTGREIRKVAAVHNLSSPTLLPRQLPKLDDFTPLTEERHHKDTDDGRLMAPLSKTTTRIDEDPSSCMSESDDSSFGVSGEWGTSDDESINGIDCQPTSLIKRS